MIILKQEDFAPITFGYCFFPHRFEYKIPEMHLEWLKHFTDNRIAIEAPAYSAKSTYWSFLRPFWKSLLVPKNEYLLLSNTGMKSIDSLAKIKLEFESNEKLIGAFGNMIGNKWTEDEIVLKNGSRIMAKGKDYQIKGWHPSDITGDDTQTNAFATPESFMQDWAWWRETVLSRADDKTHVSLINTRIHPLAIIAMIIDNKDGAFDHWTRKSYKALDTDGHSIWKARWSEAQLEEKRKEMGTIAFEQEMMNNPLAGSIGQILRNYIQYDPNIPQAPTINIFALDPAFTTDDSKKSSATGWCLIQLIQRGDRKGKAYIRLVGRDKLSPAQIYKMFFDMHKIHNFTYWGIEQVAAQKALTANILDEATKNLIWLPAPSHLSTQLQGHQASKLDRFKDISHLIENGVVLFHPSCQEFVETEVLAPNSGTLDRLDAFVYALQMARQHLQGLQFTDENTGEDIIAEPQFDENGFVIGLGQPKLIRDNIYHSPVEENARE